MQTSRLDRRSSSGGMGRLFEGPAAWLVTFLVIPALIVAVLLLPPVSLLDRLQTFTYTRIGQWWGGDRVGRYRCQFPGGRHHQWLRGAD